jgi:adhesin transport system membrane fusion protein
MPDTSDLGLESCSAFRLASRARPAPAAHATALLLGALAGSAVLWAGLTRAEVVVRGSGRVRPVSAPKKVFNAGRGEALSASAGGRVIEVNFREGDEVRRGDVLLRLDTGRLDAEIARKRCAIRAAEEELTAGERLARALRRQFEAGRDKLSAELAQAEAEAKKAGDVRRVEIRMAEEELALAEEKRERTARLAAQGAAAREELADDASRARLAQARLDRARLPADEGRLASLRVALALAASDHDLKQEELAARQTLKRGEVESARLELAGLERERGLAEITAPADGVVTAGDVKAGDVVESGKVVAEIAEQRGFRLELAVTSEEVAQLRTGMPAQVRLDAFDSQRYGLLEGKVVFIAPDSGIRDGESAATYVVRIELDGDEVGRGELVGRVKLGMTGQAEIVTGHESLLALLVKQLRRSFRLG